MLLIGLGLGFHMATFSVTYAVLLQSLPVSHPESLYLLSEVTKDPQRRELQARPHAKGVATKEQVPQQCGRSGCLSRDDEGRRAP